VRTIFQRIKCWLGWHIPKLMSEEYGSTSFDLIQLRNGLLVPWDPAHEVNALKRFTSTPKTRAIRKYYRCEACMQSLGGYLD
jgi:hypothetical protein